MAADMLIKQMPNELKDWIAGEAKRNRRSMNKEAIALLESARAMRPARPRAGENDVRVLIERFRSLPDLDRRTADEILAYDDAGLPG